MGDNKLKEQQWAKSGGANRANYIISSNHDKCSVLKTQDKCKQVEMQLVFYLNKNHLLEIH